MSAAPRRRVTLSPQYHENQLFLAPLAANVPLGGGWPVAPDNVDWAEEMCRALGLGPLIDRMPAGMLELVGEAGWQLSQGERSLVYAARSLLQGADVVLLDESFGSLDPMTLVTGVRAVVERAPALVVIRQ